MVPALSLLLALAAPTGIADRPSTDLPWLDAAGATPRWNHPLSLRLRLHPPAGDEHPLPRHCVSPTLHYGAWALPPGQLRWRVDTDLTERRSWLNLESPLPVSEPWIEVAVDWHCGALAHRQSLTLLVEPDWPGDASADDPVKVPPGTRRMIATRTDEEGASGALLPARPPGSSSPGAVSPVRTAHGAPSDPAAEPAQAAWQAVLSRLARLESGAARPGTPAAQRRSGSAEQAPEGAADRAPVPRAPTNVPAASGTTFSATSFATPPAADAGSSAAASPSASATRSVALSPTEATPGPRARPPRHAAEDGGGPTLGAWPWMLLCAGLGWAWGHRSRDRTLDKKAAQGRGKWSAPPRTPVPRPEPSPSALPARNGGTGRSGPWPAWFGAPTRPDAGAWLAGGLPHPETVAVAGVIPMARPPEDPGPWNRGLSLTEVEIDAVVWHTTPVTDPEAPETTTAATAAVS